MQPHGRAGEARAELATSADTFEHVGASVNERRKERHREPRERRGRVCGRDCPWHTRSRYTYISRRSCHGLSTRHSVTPMITLPAIIIHQPAEQTNLAGPVTIKIIIGLDRRLSPCSASVRERRKKKLSPLWYDRCDTCIVSQIINRDRRRSVTMRNYASRD